MVTAEFGDPLRAEGRENFMTRSRRSVLLLGALLATVFSTGAAGGATRGLLPDIRTIVPKQVQLVNAHQREYIRFSNGIANTGAGHWHMRPEVAGSGGGLTQNAIQEILDAEGNVVEERLVSRYEFHPEHDHWHIDRVALFEIRRGSPTGPIVGGNSIKVTFCLIDWYKLDDNPAHTECRTSTAAPTGRGSAPDGSTSTTRPPRARPST